MLKFNRNYTCKFEIGKAELGIKIFEPEETYTVDSKITLVFDINRNIFSGANTAILRFYNLAPELQASLWKDPQQVTKFVKITLSAGYGEVMPVVFTGLATQVSTYRQSGSTDFITEIQASEALFFYQYGFVNMTLAEDTKFKDFLNTIMDNQPDVELGFVSDKIANLKKDTSFYGQTTDVLNSEYGQYQIFIDNGQMHVLGEQDVIPTEEIYVITAQSGLLGSPRRMDTTVELDMLFEPGIINGQIVKVLSDSMPWLNNDYKVIGFNHRGIISPVQSGTLTTHLTLSLGEGIWNQLTKNPKEEDIVSSQFGWIKPVSDRVTSKFGVQRSTHTHKGIDYGCSMNTTVRASYKGKVITARSGISGFGTAVYIDHGKINNVNVISIYGHLNRTLVNEGEIVTTGQAIGLSGNTGYSEGPHLHFEIKENNVAVNPTKYIGGS